MAESSRDISTEATFQTVLDYLQSQGRHDLSARLQQETNQLRSMGGTPGGPRSHGAMMDNDDFHTDQNAELADNMASVSSVVSKDLFVREYKGLLSFVEKSLDRHKPELGALLFPLYAHMNIELHANDLNTDAHGFLDEFSVSQQSYWRRDIERLKRIRHKDDMRYNETCRTLRDHKYTLRMSRSAVASLKPFVDVQPDLARLIRKYMHIEAFEGSSRSAQSIDSVSGSLIGEALRSVNKTKMLYGVLKEDFSAALLSDDDSQPEMSKKKRAQKSRELRESKKNKDPTVPALTRVPLPDWSDAVKRMKRDGQKEWSKRVRLSADQPATVCMVTVLHALNGVSACELSGDTQMLACGFGGSAVRVWSLTDRPLDTLKPIAQLETLEPDDDKTRVDMLHSSGADSQYLYGHSGAVYAASFSTDNTCLLTASEDATVRLWSTQLWSPLVVYRAGTKTPVWDVQFCNRGYYFASAHADKTAAVWCTERTQPLRMFTDHLADVNVRPLTLDFHPNCNYLVTGSEDRCVRVWDLLSGQCVRHFTGLKSGVCKVRCSPDGKRVASSSYGGHVQVYDMVNARTVLDIQPSANMPIHALQWTHDSHVLALGGHHDRVQLLSMNESLGDKDMNGVSTEHSLAHAQIGCYVTKHTPVLDLAFTNKNLLIAAGVYSNNN